MEFHWEFHVWSVQGQHVLFSLNMTLCGICAHP